jgi:hypothetical protein
MAVTALGCSNLYGKNTRMQLGSCRTQRVDTGTVATTQVGGRRLVAAAQAWLPRLGSAEHNDKNERHQHAPYLAAMSRAAFTAAEEQRTGWLTAAARCYGLAAQCASSVRVGAKAARPGVAAAFIEPGAPEQVGARPHTRTRAAQGRGRTPSPTWARREVGDDQRPPPGSGRGADGPALGRRPSWAKKRREAKAASEEDRGARPNLLDGLRRNKEGKEKGFF